MMSREERLRYWERIEASRADWLADPEVAAEYELAGRAWDRASSSSPSKTGPDDSIESPCRQARSPW